ncbi:hypothetical protein M422DRAFT_274746 [Sphaerobolus stellatus SS14]|uniref:Uncharacterized protein n=1 Tax=Sphaerobolus stellatus (strain SS14) TaxID=990650 RepID=A0A0C9U5U7_SPHS4|nr:hypothetical protein M422DRAFT_274746 [Sphaerobolus stellatus SS14]
MTAVLATAVGESGKSHARTPPVGQSQRHLIANFNPGRIEFKCPQDPIGHFSAIGTTTIYDIAVLAHHLTSTGKHTTRICLTNQKTDHVFLIDFGTSLINEVAVDRNLGSSIVSQLALAKDSFLSDSQIATVHGNEYLYVLTLGKNLVTVLSLNGPGKVTVVQQFPLGDAVRKLGISEDPNQVQGLGVFVTGA